MYPSRDPEFVALVSYLMVNPEAYAIVTACDEMGTEVGEPHRTKSQAEVLELLDGSDHPWSVSVHSADVSSFMIQPEGESDYCLDFIPDGDSLIAQFYEEYRA